MDQPLRPFTSAAALFVLDEDLRIVRWNEDARESGTSASYRGLHGSVGRNKRRHLINADQVR